MLLCVGSTVVASWARRQECARITEAHRHLAHSAPCSSLAMGMPTSKAGFVLVPRLQRGGQGLPKQRQTGLLKRLTAEVPETPSLQWEAWPPRGGGWPKGRGVEAAWAPIHLYSYPSYPQGRNSGEGWRAHRDGVASGEVGPRLSHQMFRV